MLILLTLLLQTVAPMDILRERMNTLQQIYDVVQTFCEEQKNTYLQTLQQNIQEQFPSVTNEELQVLLSRYASTYGNCLTSSFSQKLYENWDIVKEIVPERVKEVLKMDMNKKSEEYKHRQEYAQYQEAMQIPKDFTNTQTLHKMLFPKKNTLLALQVINRLAREYEIRFEDVEIVLKECMI
jgi:hypothetical protein